MSAPSIAVDGPIFPGGTSVTRLSVYDGVAPDGLAGGTPHVHTVSTESYVVVSGRGALQTIDPSGYRETALGAGDVVWFTPGTIHRAINHGDLEVLVVMSNAGLPEAGDAVMVFPDHVLTSAEAYREAATLPPADGPEHVSVAAARARRDLGVEGFLALRRAADAGGAEFTSALERFYSRAAALVAPRAAEWKDIWTSTVVRATNETAAALDALASGSSDTLNAAQLATTPVSEGIKRFGMCGRLRTYDVRSPHTL